MVMQEKSNDRHSLGCVPVAPLYHSAFRTPSKRMQAHSEDLDIFALRLLTTGGSDLQWLSIQTCYILLYHQVTAGYLVHAVHTMRDCHGCMLDLSLYISTQAHKIDTQLQP